MKKSVLKKEDWGLITIATLLSTFVFPPYFIQLMTIAALSEFAHFWTTRLSRIQQDRLIKFEKQLRLGYQLEQKGNREEALTHYQKLYEKYKKFPEICQLISLQIKQMSNPTLKKALKQ